MKTPEEQIEFEKKLLAEVLQEKGTHFLYLVTNELEESGWYELKGFFEYPVGDLREEDPDFEVYVNQTTNGGHSGDDYAGTYDIKINDSKYLRVEYSM